jgi:hypothetical protein
MLVKGYVESVVETPSKFTDKTGKRKPSFWRIKVDNVMYGCGNSQPQCKEGDYVTFDAEQKGEYWNADVATLKPAKPDPREPAADHPAVPIAGGWKTNPEAETRAERLHRQDIISYQAARKDALEIVTALLAKDMIDFGKAKGAQKQAIVDILVDNYTVRFFEETAALAPEPKDSPVEAAYGEGVETMRKPAGRPRKAVQELVEPILEEKDELPWG